MQKPRFHIPSFSAVAARALLPALLLTALLLTGGGCGDRLPSEWRPPPVDSASNNSFVIDGNGYAQRLFDFGDNSARAYYFPDDTLSYIWNTATLRDSSGRTIPAAVNITFPGSSSGTFRWDNAFAFPQSPCKVRITIDTAEYLSIDGLTQAYVIIEGPTQRIRGSYAGTLRSRFGSDVTVSNGRFHGAYF
jgi:hypothetical protein